MRKTAWIWLAGAIAWTVDAGISVSLHRAQHADLAGMLALLFWIAWGFYRTQGR